MIGGCVQYLAEQLTWPFTQAAVHRVDAGLSLQAAGRRLSQVAAEAGVAGLPGQPLQGGVGEGRHVLPAPVRHVDLPEPHPGSHHGLVLKTHTHTHTGVKTRLVHIIVVFLTFQFRL